MPGGLALLSTIIPTALAAMGAPENLLKFNREKHYYPLSTKLYLSDQLVWLVRAFLYQGSMTLEPYSCKNIPKSFNATGLKLLLGEVQVNIGEGPVDQCFPPIVIVKVNPTMKLMQRVFWTNNAIMKFSSDEEAVRYANCSRDVLGCAVFLGSQCRAKHTASQIQSGVAAVNDFASSYMFQSLPFGIFTGMEELRARCLVKSVVVDRWWPCIKPRYLSLFGNLLLRTDKVPRLSCGGSLLFEHLASIMGIDE